MDWLVRVLTLNWILPTSDTLISFWLLLWIVSDWNLLILTAPRYTCSPHLAGSNDELRCHTMYVCYYTYPGTQTPGSVAPPQPAPQTIATIPPTIAQPTPVPTVNENLLIPVTSPHLQQQPQVYPGITSQGFPISLRTLKVSLKQLFRNISKRWPHAWSILLTNWKDFKKKFCNISKRWLHACMVNIIDQLKGF